MAPWGRKGERWLGCCTALSPATPSHSPPPHTHRGALSTPGSFGTSDTSRTLGRGRKQVRKHAGGGLQHACQAMPQISRGYRHPQGSAPILGCSGCTHLRARCARGTLGTGSTGVTLLPGLSLFAFGTGLPVGTLQGSGCHEWVEPTLDPCRGKWGQILTGGPANPAGPGAPGSPRSPCG